MSTITINGKRITVQGNNISVINGVVFVDGKKVEEGLTGTVDIRWEGPLASLKADGSVTCGDVGGRVDAGGNVECKTVSGDVDAGGNVHCGEVKGNVDAGGNITCGHVGGNVDAGGGVRMTK